MVAAFVTRIQIPFDSLTDSFVYITQSPIVHLMHTPFDLSLSDPSHHLTEVKRQILPE